MTTERPRASHPVLLSAVAVLPAVVFWLLNLHWGFTVNLFELGTVMEGGRRIGGGQALYTDFFSFYGPLGYLLPYAALLLSGSVVVAAGVLDLVVAVLSSWVTYRLAAALSGRPAVALVAPLCLALVGGTTARTLAPLAGVLCLCAWETTQRSRWLLGVGAFTSVGLLWIQDGGAWLTLAVLLVAAGGLRSERIRAVLGPRHLGRIVVGGTVAALPVLVWLTVTGALTAWFYWCFVFPNTAYTDRDSTGYITDLVASWQGLNPVVLAYKATFYLLPYVVIGVAAVACTALALSRRVTSRTTAPVTFLVLSVYAVLQLRVLVASVDEAKLADSCAPTVVAACALAAAYLGRPGRGPGRQMWAPALAALVLAWLVVWPLQHRLHAVAHTDTVATPAASPADGLPVGSIGPPETSAAELDELVREVRARTSPGDPILVLPTSPLVYVLTERSNPTEYDYLDPVYIDAEADRSIAASVEAREPALVVVGDNTFAGTPTTGPDMAPQTYAAIEAAYVEVAQVGHFTVLEPR